MKRAIFSVFIVLTIGWPLTLASRPSDDGAAVSKDVLQFRLMKEYLVLVECSVAGHSGLTAVLDTGTTETVLDQNLVRRLGLPVKPDSATSLATDSAASAVSIPDLQVGPLLISHLDGISLDLSQIGAQLGVRPDVILGMDVLHRQNFTINYSSRVIWFGAQSILPHRASLHPSNRFLLLDSTVLGQPVTLKLDTGFNGLLLYGNRVEGIARLASSREPDGGVSGVAQASTVRNVDSAEVKIGDWRSPRLPIAILENGPLEVNFYDGLLGAVVLHAKRLAFDFDRHLLSWE